MICRLALVLALGLAAPAIAETDIAIAAKRAAAHLNAAAAALHAADGARDRVAALTRTVRAYEEGLVALREGLRRATLREAALRAQFDAERERIARLLGVLQSIEAAPAQLTLLHPSGPLGTARTGMILADVAPALQRRAEALRKGLEELALMRALQESAAATLVDGLAGAQEARTALSQAISNRTDLPRRFLDDPGAAARLAESSETLEGFAVGLTRMTEAGTAPEGSNFDSVKGELPLPVVGTVIRRAGEADAAGIRRPGVVIATAPRALVTVPWPATIRYLGPLLDYGNVMVLEPDHEYLLVLAGLDKVYGVPGEVLPAGAPVGLMGGKPDAAAILAVAAEGGGDDRSETLYMEMRQGGAPVDPAEWFAFE